MPTLLRESVDPYLTKLGELPFVRSARWVEPDLDDGEGARGDGAVDLELVDGSTERLRLELKSSHLGADAARYLRARFDDDPGDWLLAAPYVGAPLGESLTTIGIQFIDRQGNCSLRIGDRFIARQQGKAPPKPPARRKAMRAAGYQVLFALLAEPDLVGATQRDIAAAAGTSRQPVVDLLERLREERVLVNKRRRHAWATRPGADHLERWIAGYRSVVRPKLIVGRFRLPVRGPDDVERWLEDRLEHVQFGGTAGAYRLEPHYRGIHTVAHLGPPSEETRRLLKASPAGDGELIWMRHIGEASKHGETADTAHPLLIYSELISDPDPRSAEAADLIRERRLSWSL